jgi:hypothetical protein
VPPPAAALTVVWAYHRTGKFAFHALTGALETDPRTAAVPIEFATGVAALVAAIAQARSTGRRVLVGWSSFSPGFPALVAELVAVRQAVADALVLHVAGGVHASAEPAATLRAGFDLVAVGEGELLIRDLVATLCAGGEPRAVTGVAHLDAAGRLVRNGRGELYGQWQQQEITAQRLAQGRSPE